MAWQGIGNSCTSRESSRRWAENGIHGELMTETGMRDQDALICGVENDSQLEFVEVEEKPRLDTEAMVEA